MSAMDVDKSLEDMIAARKPAGKGGRPGRGGPRRGGAAAGGRGGAQAPGGARARYAGNVPGSAAAMNPAVQAANQQKQATSEALKIIISNLPLDVEEAAVRELMITTVGPVKVVELTYDSRGKSKGVATVIFKNRGSAQKAFDQYNNRMIDQRRPLKVEIIIDPSRVPLAARVAPLPVVAPAPPRGGAGPVRRGRAAAATTKRPAPRPKKTAEDLDKEMLEYAAAGNSAA